jgi:hypothetical protein
MIRGQPWHADLPFCTRQAQGLTDLLLNRGNSAFAQMLGHLQDPA